MRELIIKWYNWRQREFKIKINTEKIGIKTICRIFEVKIEKWSDLCKDDSWYELLGKIFGIKVKDVMERLKEIDEKNNLKLREDYKSKIIKAYGGKNWDEKVAFEELVMKWPVWRRGEFKIKIDNKETGVTALCGIFWVKREIYNDLLKDDCWYELLGEIFGMEIEEIEKKL